MNVVVPLAGRDENFERNGLPKPLTLVDGKPIIQHIAESRPFSYREAVFVLLREHQKKYRIDERLKGMFGKKIRIVWAEELSGGAPQSILLAKDLLNCDEPLLIDLADQYLDLPGFMDFISNTEADGVIPTFESYYPNRGYMTYDARGRIGRVSEKDSAPISTHSTACISYFRKGSDFIDAAQKMIEGRRVAANGAYLVSLAFNEMIQSGKAVVPFGCEFIASLGTISGAAAFSQLVRPLKCKKELLRARISECPIFLHRGDRAHPENSLRAIKAALEAGCSVEIDARKAKDGVFVLSHDDSLKRLTGADIQVSSAGSDAVCKIKFSGGGEGPATLDAALDSLANQAFGTFAIHVKDKAREDVIAAICMKILQRRLENRVFLFGDGPNSRPVASMAKSFFPSINTGLHLQAGKEGLESVPDGVDVLWVDEDKAGLITEEIPLIAARRGILCVAMSPELITPGVSRIEASKRCGEFFRYGFNAVCTDYS